MMNNIREERAEVKILLYKDATEENLDGILSSLRCLLPHSPIMKHSSGNFNIRLVDFQSKFNSFTDTYTIIGIGVVV